MAEIQLSGGKGKIPTGQACDVVVDVVVAPAAPPPPPDGGPPPAGDAPPTGAMPTGGAPVSAPPTDRILRHDDPRLTPVRKRMIAELEMRMPSAFGAAAAPGKINLFEGTAQQTTGTSCGLLPGVLMRKLGVKGLISSFATEGVRTEGQRLGVWEVPEGGHLPTPGDIYVLRYADDPNSDRVAHVGVIYDITEGPGMWTTGDAGQGSKARQEAHFVRREMALKDGVHPFLTGPANTPGDSPHFRRLGGWVNLDKLMATAGG
jgi:hypothetical protein